MHYSNVNLGGKVLNCHENIVKIILIGSSCGIQFNISRNVIWLSLVWLTDGNTCTDAAACSNQVQSLNPCLVCLCHLCVCVCLWESACIYLVTLATNNGWFAATEIVWWFILSGTNQKRAFSVTHTHKTCSVKYMVRKSVPNSLSVTLSFEMNRKQSYFRFGLK